MWMANMEMAGDRISKLRALMEREGDTPLKPPEAAKVKAAAVEWYGFSQILEQVAAKTAGVQGEEAKLAQEMTHLMGEVKKAAAEYMKLEKAGSLLSESAVREAQAVAKLPAAILAMQTAIAKQWGDKQREELAQAHLELTSRLEAQEGQTAEIQERHWNTEIERLRAGYAKKKLLTAENEKLIEDIRAAGLAKIQRDSLSAYQQELVQLQGFLAQMVTSRLTAAERLEYQYDLDLANLSAAKMEASIIVAGGEERRASIEAQYALNRTAVLQKYGKDLVALENSQGWNGVFGSRFAQLLQHDEAALREWATSADQAFNMVSQRMVGLEGLGRMAFNSLATGMGQNIASAIVYSKSVAQAMQAALAATLESVAAESMVQSIYALALGFLRLAQHNPVAASAAFTSAAMFGTIGGVAAVAGRLVAPKDDKAAAAAGAGGGASGSAGGGAAGGGGAAAGQGYNLTVIVQGNAYTVDPLIDAINEAVTQRDKALTATNTTTGQVVYR
jgi:hypothetical protein